MVGDSQGMQATRDGRFSQRFNGLAAVKGMAGMGMMVEQHLHISSLQPAAACRKKFWEFQPQPSLMPAL
ncbi:hypothetical protein CE91St46_12090 [Eubacteriales bacterium]|nr:hypothetical protein CE91St46_12090 [Eubacteriales bacterium]GKH62734.1 hypothetical protein CE91St47_12030 [Eubacteriales bacterium]